MLLNDIIKNIDLSIFSDLTIILVILKKMSFKSLIFAKHYIFFILINYIRLT